LLFLRTGARPAWKLTSPFPRPHDHRERRQIVAAPLVNAGAQRFVDAEVTAP
jgi:hypothetical protein